MCIYIYNYLCVPIYMHTYILKETYVTWADKWGHTQSLRGN